MSSAGGVAEPALAGLPPLCELRCPSLASSVQRRHGEGRLEISHQGYFTMQLANAVSQGPPPAGESNVKHVPAQHWF